MTLWLSNFLVNLLTPLLEKLGGFIAAELEKLAKEKEDQKINQAEKDTNAAETEDEIKKAADETRRALGGA